MSPESRSRSSYGPFPRRSTWLAGAGVVSLALALAGVSSPVLAVAQPAKATTAVNVADPKDDGKCDREGRDRKCPEKPNGNGPNGAVCNDIDAYRPNANEEVKAVTYNGETFAGIRNLTPDVTPFVWSDLTDNANYPENACSVSIASQANDVSVEVLTTTGEIYETECTIDQGEGEDPDALVCDAPWVELTTPFENGPTK